MKTDIFVAVITPIIILVSWVLYSRRENKKNK